MKNNSFITLFFLIFTSVNIFGQDFKKVKIHEKAYYIFPEKFDSENDNVYIIEWKYENVEFPNGWYIAFYEDNKTILFKGQIISDKEHGKWTHYYRTGEVKSIKNYKNGLSEGKTIYFNMPNYKSRIKNPESSYYYKSEEHLFENGLENGVMTMWNKEGLVLRQGLYKNGKKEGVWKWFHHNGNLEILTKYKNGFSVGKSTRWYENKTIESVKNYKDSLTTNEIANLTDKFYSFSGLGINTWKEYYPNGQLKYQYSFKDFEPFGDIKKWNDNGEIVSNQKYLYGFPVDEITTKKDCNICGRYYGQYSSIAFFSNGIFTLGYGRHGERFKGKWKLIDDKIILKNEDAENIDASFIFKGNKLYPKNITDETYLEKLITK